MHKNAIITAVILTEFCSAIVLAGNHQLLFLNVENPLLAEEDRLRIASELASDTEAPLGIRTRSRMSLAKLRKNRGEDSKAADILQGVIKDSSVSRNNRAEATIELARILKDSGQSDAAIELISDFLEFSLETDPDLRTQSVILAMDIFIETERNAEAIEFIEDWWPQTSNACDRLRAETLTWKGKALEIVGRLDHAKQTYSQIIDEYPRFAGEAWINKCSLSVRENKPDQLVRDLCSAQLVHVLASWQNSVEFYASDRTARRVKGASGDSLGKLIGLAERMVMEVPIEGRYVHQAGFFLEALTEILIEWEIADDFFRARGLK